MYMNEATCDNIRFKSLNAYFFVIPAGYPWGLDGPGLVSTSSVVGWSVEARKGIYT